jgi:rod shape determining protein RodA
MLNTAVIVGIGISFLANYVFYEILEPHQQDRINVWLQPSKCDPRGSLYNVLQSKMAISSGGLQGKGFLKGTMTKLNYVPEQSTDFIFCTVGEEQGFLGSFGIIALYFLLLYRITAVAERQRSGFSRRYAYAIAGILFVHYIINIGMTMGLMPIIGIPLPFISKGGSSLLGFTVMLAVLLKLDANRGVG